MKSLTVRLLGSLGLGLTALVAGAADPAPASAHCGGHGGSCGVTGYAAGSWCSGSTLVTGTDYYFNDCSGTCYNGGQSGCCISPEACADEPCKPGGCGGACGYWYTNYDYREDPSCYG